MPMLVGIIAVLFQFGILFVAYLSIVNETRDIGRFVSVHPDTIDGVLATACTATGTLWRQVCDDAPTVIDPARLTPTFTPACASLTAGKCTGRTAGTQMTITLQYTAAGSIVFLPTNFQLGPWLKVAIPIDIPSYSYFVMVETH